MKPPIVPCWKCKAPLTADLFARKEAFRIGDKVSCKNCVPQAPSPRETTSVRVVPRPTPTGARTTSKIPRPAAASGTRRELREASPRRKSRTAVWVIVGVLVAGGLAAGGFLLFTGGGGPPQKPASVARKAPSAEGADPEGAKRILRNMELFKKDHPDDFTEIMKSLREAEKRAAGTPVAADVRTDLNDLRRKIAHAASGIKEETKDALSHERFSSALALLEQAKARHALSEWEEALRPQIQEIRDQAQDLYGPLEEQARASKKSGDGAKVDEILMRVAAWGMVEYEDRLKESLSGLAKAPPPAAPPISKGPETKQEDPKPVPPGLSPELQTYRARWAAALGLAFWRDYASAAADIRRAGREGAVEEVRKEAEEDAQALQDVEKLVERAGKSFAGMAPDEVVLLSWQRKPKEYEQIQGSVVRADGQWIELKMLAPAPPEGKPGEEKKEPKAKIVLVAVADLSADSLLSRLARPRLSGEDARAGALLCLLEGDSASARGHHAFPGNIPDKYWKHAEEAVAKAPAPPGGEFEARNLLRQAELQWRDINLWADAIEKYKTLQREFGTARVVSRNIPLIVKRALMGKEYILQPPDLEGLGGFERRGHGEMKDAWISARDLQAGAKIQGNYVGVKFYALPDISYKAWAYLGGCCKETFDFYLQATDVFMPDPKTRKPTVNIAPGIGASLFEPKIRNLKKDHKDHKGEKEPARWEWIEIPLPGKYPAPGPKEIRFLTNQGGFSVGFVVVSSTRAAPPDAGETEKFRAELMAPPAAAPEKPAAEEGAK